MGMLDDQNGRGLLAVYIPQRVDQEGVPTVVQELQYLSASMLFKVKFFNGAVLFFNASWLCPDIEWANLEPTPLQYSEAETRVLLWTRTNWGTIRGAGR